MTPAMRPTIPRTASLNMDSSGAISSFAGPTIQELPAIASWDDLDPEVDLHEIEIPGEGTIWFGSRVFDEGDGTFRYEYAIFNLNVDRSIGAIRVPWSDGNPLSSSIHKAPEWHSGEQFSNTGWSMTTGGGEMVWSSEPFASNEMANAVRWGNLQNITIVTTAQPEAGHRHLGHVQARRLPLAVRGHPSSRKFDGRHQFPLGHP